MIAPPALDAPAMTDPTCPPHTPSVILEDTDDRDRTRTVGRLCPGCGLILNPNGGGFTDGSAAQRRAVRAAAYLDPDRLADLAPTARRRLETLRRSLR